MVIDYYKVALAKPSQCHHGFSAKQYKDLLESGASLPIGDKPKDKKPPVATPLAMLDGEGLSWS